MTKFRITAPVETFRGDLAGLIFRDGEAVADSETDRAALDYCRRRGYRVEPLDTPANVEDANDLEVPEVLEDGDDGEDGEVGGPIRPRSSDPKADWVSYATNHPDEGRRLSAEDADALTKAELVELYSK